MIPRQATTPAVAFFITPSTPIFTKIRVNTFLFVLSQPANFSPASPFILPHLPLSPHNPTIPESDFCHPCTFAPSFKAQPTGAHVGHATKTSKQNV